VPSLVPPGFTRGPILFIGPAQSESSDTSQLQRFWTEGGSYGARILILMAGAHQAVTKPYQHLFAAWETEWVQVINIQSRSDAQQTQHQATIDAATAILLLEENPLRFAALLGGTPVATAVRRANARGKVVGGVGRGGSVLCQHMLILEDHLPEPLPLINRRLAQFAPGLGIINRVLLEADARTNWQTDLSRLLSAVAQNPFLIGISLEPGAGAVIYPDSTLEVFGEQRVLIVDGGQISYTNAYADDREQPISLLGVQLHVLAAGYTFNLDDRNALPPASTDLPTTAVPAQSKSPF